MNNKTKTILFASSIATAIISFGSIGMADAKTEESKTKQDFKDDIKAWLQDTDEDKKSERQKTEELKTNYDKLLRDSIEEARMQTNTKNLDENEIQAAIQYITHETIKDEKLKVRMAEGDVKTLNVDFLNSFDIQTADAACPSTTHPNYKQVRIDIDGGTYGGHSFNGDNDLYIVLYSDNSRTCERTYTLYFYDEDHPDHDELYDQLRIDWYGRIHDIESFSIKNNNKIEFDDTWSSTNDFDCLTWIAFGCHATTTKTYVPGQTIYVSNTWNHMMDTSDTNPSLSKVSVP